MTLDEAIRHCEEKAEELEKEAGFETDYECYKMSDEERESCIVCAKEHRQLAEWLKQLETVKELVDGYIDGFDYYDAMNTLYQIREVTADETNN